MKKIFFGLFLFIILPTFINAKGCKYAFPSTQMYSEKPFGSITITFNDNGTLTKQLLNTSGKVISIPHYDSSGVMWNFKDFNDANYISTAKVGNKYQCPDLKVAIDSSGSSGIISQFVDENRVMKVLTLKGTAVGMTEQEKTKIVQTCKTYTFKKDATGVIIDSLTFDEKVELKSNSVGQRIFCVNGTCTESASGTTGAQMLQVTNQGRTYNIEATEYNNIFKNFNNTTNKFTCPSNLYISASTMGNSFTIATAPDQATPSTPATQNEYNPPNFEFDSDGEVECDDIEELVDWLNTILKFVQYGVIALVVVLCMLDYTKALTASDADALKKANQKVVKRIIIVVALLIVGPVLNFIINLLTDGAVSTCGL